MSASTRPIDAASLQVGMTTETRTAGSPERDVGIAAGKRGVDAEPASGSAEREARRDHHRDEELPDPRGPPLRHPEAREEAERGERDGAARETEDQEDAEAELRRRLQRCGNRGVPGHETHDRLPRERGAALLDVVADQARIALGRVEALAEVLEEHPHEHRPEHEAEDREQRRRFGRGGAHGAQDTSLPNTVVQALPAFGNSRRLPAYAARIGRGLPFTNGQNSSGRSSPPRSPRRLGQPPWQTSTSGQVRQTSGSASSSVNTGERTIDGPRTSRSARPRDRFGQ